MIKAIILPFCTTYKQRQADNYLEVVYNRDIETPCIFTYTNSIGFNFNENGFENLLFKIISLIHPILIIHVIYTACFTYLYLVNSSIHDNFILYPL